MPLPRASTVFLSSLAGLLASATASRADDPIAVLTEVLYPLVVGQELSLDLSDTLQLYPAPGPTAFFDIQLPLTTEPRALFNQPLRNAEGVVREDGRIVPDRQTNPLLSQAYQLSAASTAAEDYDSIFALFPGDVAFAPFSLPFQLWADAAPTTVANFIQYARDGHYQNSHVHRVIASDIKILQAGGFRVNPAANPAWIEVLPTRDPIPLEAGRPHLPGTLALARAQHSHSGSSQFFINLSDNSSASADGVRTWSDDYSAFGAFTGDSLDPLNAITNALVYSYASFWNFFPAGYSSVFASTPSITPYIDVHHRNWFFFDDIRIAPSPFPAPSFAIPDFFVDLRFDVRLDGTELTFTARASGTFEIPVTLSVPDGPSVQTQLRFVVARPHWLDLFPDASVASDDWLGTWLGWLHSTDFPSCLHINHGFLQFTESRNPSQVFFFDFENAASPKTDSLGWVFTTPDFYPWLYSYALGEWLQYLEGTGDPQSAEGPRWFFRPATPDTPWITDFDLLNPPA